MDANEDTAKWERLLDEHARVAKHTLTGMLAAGSGFAPMIIAFRGMSTVCMVIPPEGDGEMIAATATLMASGFGADSIMITSDTWGAHTLLSPLTGRPWRPGEMAEVAARHDGLARGLVHEALILTVISRDRSQTMRQIPYKRAADGKSVTWLDGDGEDGTGRSAWVAMSVGRFAHVLDAGKWKDLTALKRKLGREPTRAEMDYAVAESLADVCTQVMLVQRPLITEN